MRKRRVESFDGLHPLICRCVVFGSQPSLFCQSSLMAWSGKGRRRGCKLSLKRLPATRVILGARSVGSAPTSCVPSFACSLGVRFARLRMPQSWAEWPDLPRLPPPSQLLLEQSDLFFFCLHRIH